MLYARFLARCLSVPILVLFARGSDGDVSTRCMARMASRSESSKRILEPYFDRGQFSFRANS